MCQQSIKRDAASQPEKGEMPTPLPILFNFLLFTFTLIQ